MRRCRIDCSHPTYECCDLLFEYRDEDPACAICGEAFDWPDLLEAWNPEDYMTADELAELYGVRPDDPQQTLWGQWDAFESDPPEDEGYIELPWQEPASVARRPARSPTQHLPSVHRQEGPDPLLVALPDGVI